MPTKLPRLNVSITEHQHALLAELGRLQGRSSASFLREMLDQSTPMLEAILPIMRAAAEQVAMQPKQLSDAIRNAVAEVDAQKAQMNLLKLMVDTEHSSANDRGGDAASSGAREDIATPRKRRKGA